MANHRIYLAPYRSNPRKNKFKELRTNLNLQLVLDNIPNPTFYKNIPLDKTLNRYEYENVLKKY